MSTRTLVFGDDRSPHADRAWLWINQQPWPGWVVDVVTADPQAGDLTSNDLAVRLHRGEPEAPRVAMPQSAIREVRHWRTRADAGIALRARRDAAVMVIGPRGVSGLKAAFVGSTAEHLIRRPVAPLVVATRPDPANRVLVCVDGSQEAQAAVAAFAELPLAQAATDVVVLGVTRLEGDAREPVRQGMEAAAEHLGTSSCSLVEVALDGTVPQTLTKFARGWRAQFVVVGTRCPHGLERLFHGSTSTGVAHAMECPVMVVPSRTEAARNTAAAGDADDARSQDAPTVAR